MASKTQICNLALTSLSQETISDISENSTAARLLNAKWDLVLDKILCEHNWKFATKRVALAKLVTVPAYGYDAEFQLPTDYLKYQELSDGSVTVMDFAIEGGKVLCDYDAINLKYTRRVPETEIKLFSAEFIDAFAALLASEIAYALTTSGGVSEKLRADYVDRLALAMANDSQSAGERVIGASEWEEARY